MDERAALLEQLKLDREEPIKPRRRVWSWLLVGSGCAGAAGCTGGRERSDRLAC